MMYALDMCYLALACSTTLSVRSTFCRRCGMVGVATDRRRDERGVRRGVSVTGVLDEDARDFFVVCQ